MSVYVLAAITVSAGLASSAFGAAPYGEYRIEVRLVVDGEAGAPIGPGITSYGSGPNATRVGLTLQSRVVETAHGTGVGSGNYGIAGVLAASAAPRARFTHTDAASGASYDALRRGQTGTALGGDGLPIAGFFDGQNNPADLEGGSVRRDFRFQGVTHNPGTASADVNSLTGNAVGADGLNGNSGNGFIGDDIGSGLRSISGLSSAVNLLPPTDPVAYATGEWSPWYNLYRVYFDPSIDSGGATRDVTVSFSGRIISAFRSYPSPIGLRAISTGSDTPGYAVGAKLDVESLSATFTVPAPSVVGLAGLAVVVGLRRRRSV